MSQTPETLRRRVVEEAARLETLFRRQGLTKAALFEALALTYGASNAVFADVNARLSAAGKFTAECAAGCNYCCHTLATAHETEVLALAAYAERRFSAEALAALKARVFKTDSLTRGRDGAWRYVNRVACPMLDMGSGMCSVHPARPMACRALHSGSRARCEEAFVKRDPTIPTPSIKFFFEQSEICHAAFREALSRFGVTSRTLDLNAALAIYWSEPDAVTRWLKGEDAFAGARLN